MRQKLQTVYIRKKIRKLGTQKAPSKEWIAVCSEIQKLEHRDIAVKWSLMAFSIILLATLGIYFLQGFHVARFELPEPMLKGLEWSTIGQTVGLVSVVFKFLFK